ncbi:glucosamine-6-phosphate deaminase [Parenemella sanctibonifatiensis]|uniref:Glucosamine-6-phosphate deaminase n=1 Tax=Parenemella sanctibonifatiensis TaxID=2016505 RepID=A0A255ELP7_9ACTN|nr:glucosamine-6-phosphate deaminase [Parenemella sanctibonifatiensis]OYN92457.1 glucosamine-6-phosphate deaminase [Parenemella sanctibonifatiensis]
MEVVICATADEVGRVAGANVARECAGLAAPVIGVATGSSPLGLYADLADRVAAGSLDLSAAHAFALDEYVGLSYDHPESYHAVIDRTVTRPLGLDPDRVHVPDGLAEDVPAACAAYEQAIRDAGGVDVQILGLGSNGHIGFNEPSSSLRSRTRIKTLAPATREANQRFFDSLDEVPTHCLTQGLGTIMDARAVVLVAQGEGKADAVAATIEGALSSRWPGSILQLHPAAYLVIDEAAASKLELRDYYRYVYDHKPDWQRAR